MQAFLQITAGDNTYEKQLTGDRVTVGRESNNSIAFPDPKLSALHFFIEPMGDQYYLVDIGSEGGTYVNGKLASKTLLKSSDRIVAGQIEFVFWQAEAVAASKEALIPDVGVNEPVINESVTSKFTAPSKPAQPKPQTQSDTSKPLEVLSASNELSLKSSTSMQMINRSSSTQDPATKPKAPQALVGEAAATTSSQLPQPPQPPQQPQSPQHSVEAPPAQLYARTPPQISGLAKTLTSKPVKIDKTPAAIKLASKQHIVFLRKLLTQLVDQTIDEDDLTIVNTNGEIMPIAASHEITEAIEEDKESGPILRLLLLLALRFRATDVHIEPREDRYSIRLRVDGVMVNILNIHHSIGGRLVRVVKVLGQIDISQQNAVQEGHFASDTQRYRIYYRISFTPSLHGQKLVLRILDEAQSPHRLEDLGLPAWILEELKDTIQEDTGMLLVCGPTGSGKTSTLYSLIREVDRNTRNVVTIEDPVEYEIEDTTQLPINEVQGQTFSSMLRSVLRQDPDLLLIGEVRDSETANIAMQAAMTGHQVLSTIHAKNTIGALFRLLNLDIDRYLLASSINLILAQRLARVLCKHCKYIATSTARYEKIIEQYKLDPNRIYEAKGCPTCLQTGYNGRRAFFEMLIANDALRDTIMSTPQIQDIRKAIQTREFISLHESGYQLVSDGDTAIPEIQRLLGREHR